MPILLNPYEYLLEVFPDVEVKAANLGDLWGLTEWDQQGHPTIFLALDLGAIARRCVLAHEIRHVHRGAPCQALCPMDEADCREDTARWLLPDIEQLGRMMSRLSLAQAAERLQVVPAIIDDRVDNFTEQELDLYRAQFSVHPAAGIAAACNTYSAPRRTPRDRRHPCRRTTA